MGNESFNAQQCAPCTSTCRPGFELNLSSALCDGSDDRNRVCERLLTTTSVAPATSTISTTPEPTATTTPKPVACRKGEFIGDNSTNPITCYPCKHGASYHCGQGRFRNGTACNGTGSTRPALPLFMDACAGVLGGRSRSVMFAQCDDPHVQGTKTLRAAHDVLAFVGLTCRPLRQASPL